MITKVQRGASQPRCFPATSGRGAGDPKLAQIFACGKSLHPCRMLLHGASNLDQRCLKMCISEDGCTFPPNIFTCTPKITPEPHIGGQFNAKPMHGALHKLHVNGATMLKLYSYIGIGKYFGMECIKIFPLGCLGGTRLLNANLEPQYYLGNYWS